MYKCSRFSSCKFKIPISSLSPPFHVFQLRILLQSTNHLIFTTLPFLCTSHRQEKQKTERESLLRHLFRRNKAFSKVQKMFNGHSLSAFFLHFPSSSYSTPPSIPFQRELLLFSFLLNISYNKKTHVYLSKIIYALLINP